MADSFCNRLKTIERKHQINVGPTWMPLGYPIENWGPFFGGAAFLVSVSKHGIKPGLTSWIGTGFLIQEDK